jgi:hypothetical protein
MDTTNHIQSNRPPKPQRDNTRGNPRTTPRLRNNDNEHLINHKLHGLLRAGAYSVKLIENSDAIIEVTKRGRANNTDEKSYF